MMSHGLPPRAKCYHYFRKWSENGLLIQTHTALRQQVRPHPFRRHRGQSVRVDDRKRGQSDEDDRDYDGNKKVKGLKRHLLVDTNGLVRAVCVSAADLGEREGAKSLLTLYVRRFPRLSEIWADSGYDGPFAAWVKKQMGAD